MAFTAEQQTAVDNLTAEQKAAFEAKRALLRAEEGLVGLKDGAETDFQREAKLMLRTQRQLYRERWRPIVMSFEQRYNLWTTVDGFEPTENPPVYVKGGP
jgi:hypothetical protein